MSRLHLVGFPHTALDDPGSVTCAYTQKIRKFIDMGWGDRLSVYTGNRPRDLDAQPTWPGSEEWRKFNGKVIRQLRHERPEPGDLLLLAGGVSQKVITHQFPYLTACEPGVGYTGVFTDLCAFESYAWQHYVYGQNRWDGRAYDTVIPNYFDPAEFPHLNDGRGDYLLFMGRIVTRKGPHVAVEIAERAGLPLHVAGPLSAEIDIRGRSTYLGVLQPHERAQALAGAAALIVPTLYVEPFGGVAVEAMLAGTPVVASDWGAFVETVEEGVTGARFRTLAEAEAAVARARDLRPERIRDRAIERFSLQAVKPMYERWFDRLDTLQGDGYYAKADVA